MEDIGYSCVTCGFHTSGDIEDLLSHIRGHHDIEIRTGLSYFAHCNEQEKALDNEALHKLENLSKRSSTDGQGMGTSGGKYHHLSVAFMTR